MLVTHDVLPSNELGPVLLSVMSVRLSEEP